MQLQSYTPGLCVLILLSCINTRTLQVIDLPQVKYFCFRNFRGKKLYDSGSIEYCKRSCRRAHPVKLGQTKHDQIFSEA